MSTAAQVLANQNNAQLSTGPTTADGKTKSSKNALKTGLTGHTVLLPTDDAALYQKHLDSFIKQYAPQGDQETELVQSIADTAWRIARIPSLEAGIYAVGPPQTRRPPPQRRRNRPPASSSKPKSSSPTSASSTTSASRKAVSAASAKRTKPLSKRFRKNASANISTA